MEKSTLIFKPVENDYETMVFQEQTIKFKKRLSPEDMVMIVESYVDDYFNLGSPASQVVTAEYGLKSALFQVTVLNFDIPDGLLMQLFSTELFDKITSNVVNYTELRDMISKTIQKIEKENSFETKMSDVADKIMEVVAKISSGASEESLKSIVDSINDLKRLGEKVKG